MVYYGPVFWFMVIERNGLPRSCPIVMVDERNGLPGPVLWFMYKERNVLNKGLSFNGSIL
jgi:hypothetical protein